MTRLFEEAIATVARLPEAQQDELARILFRLTVGGQPPYLLSPEEEADLDASIEAEERGEFATDDEIRAMRAKHGR